MLRCYETCGTAVRAEICLAMLGREFTAGFGKCEIKTFRIPKDADRPVVETDLLEMRAG